jgi:cell division septation protein DedD
MRSGIRHAKRTAGQGWLSTLLGVFVLVAGGFALGLVVGVISEEPELVVGYVAGQTTEIEWSAAGANGDPEAGASEAAPTPGDWPMAADGRPEGSSTEASSDSPARRLPSVAAPGNQRAASNAHPSASAQVAPTAPTIAPSASSSSGAANRAAPAAADDPSSSFAIQVGAFGDAKAAQGVAGRLRASGYPVQVVPPASDDRWRVRVGPIRSRVEADETAQRLKVDENLPTWVLRESLP